jgi:hypothetical protein
MTRGRRRPTLRGSATRDSEAMARLEDKVRATDWRGKGGRRRIGVAAPPPFPTCRWRGGMMTAMMEAPYDDDDNNASEGCIGRAASSSEGRLCRRGEKNRRQTTEVRQPPRGGIMIIRVGRPNGTSPMIPNSGVGGDGGGGIESRSPLSACLPDPSHGCAGLSQLPPRCPPPLPAVVVPPSQSFVDLDNDNLVSRPARRHLRSRGRSRCFRGDGGEARGASASRG